MSLLQFLIFPLNHHPCKSVVALNNNRTLKKVQTAAPAFKRTSANLCNNKPLKKFAKKTSSFSTERITIVELICCQNSYQRHTYDSVQSITYVARPPIANRERTVFTPLFHTFIQLCHKSYSIQHQRFIGIVEDQTT